MIELGIIFALYLVWRDNKYAREWKKKEIVKLLEIEDDDPNKGW